MELLTRTLFGSQETIELAIHRFLSLLDVQVNLSTLSSRQEHPDYPSLLSIKDVVDSFGFETLALRPDPDQWAQVDIPFMTQLSGQDRFAGSFTVVRPLADGHWEYVHPGTRKWVSLERSAFSQHFMPVALFAEAGEDAGEPDYQATRRRDLIERLGSWAKIAALPLSAVVILLIGYLSVPAASITQSVYFLTMLLGAAVGSLLLLYEIDKHNPIVKQVCSGGNAKANCHAVLESSGGKLFGVSWSLIGFTYFVGGTVLMLFAPPARNVYFPLLSLLSLAALPYVGTPTRIGPPKRANILKNVYKSMEFWTGTQPGADETDILHYSE